MGSVFAPCFTVCIALCHSSYAIILMAERERAGCFTLNIFLVTVLVLWLFFSVPWEAMGRSVVCDCGIS